MAHATRAALRPSLRSSCVRVHRHRAEPAVACRRARTRVKRVKPSGAAAAGLAYGRHVASPYQSREGEKSGALPRNPSCLLAARSLLAASASRRGRRCLDEEEVRAYASAGPPAAPRRASVCSLLGLAVLACGCVTANLVRFLCLVVVVIAGLDRWEMLSSGARWQPRRSGWAEWGGDALLLLVVVVPTSLRVGEARGPVECGGAGRRERLMVERKARARWWRR